MNLSLRSQSIVTAHAKGYRVMADGSVVSPKGKVRKLQTTKDGYKVFRHSASCIPIPAHRLQAYQKFGDALFAGNTVVRHLDGNPANNSFENIALGTPSENMMDKPKHVRLASAITASRMAQRHDHNAICAFLAQGNSYEKAMKAFGVSSKGTISFIARQSMAMKARRPVVQSVFNI